MLDVDDLLRTAYADLAATVRQDDIGLHAPTATRPARSPGARIRSRWVIAVAAAAAVLLVVIAAGLIPRALQSGAGRAGGAPVRQHMAYVVTGQGTVIPVSLGTGTALAPIRLGAAGGPEGMVITPNGKTVYVATARGQVTPVDIVTGTAERPIRIGGVPQAMVMTPNGRTGYVLEAPYGVAVVNFVTNTPAGFVKIPDTAQFVITPDGKTLYVVNRAGSKVTPVETATNKPLRPITTALNGFQSYLAMTPDGRTVYVVGTRQMQHSPAAPTGVITPISTATNSVLRPIELGQADGPIRISPDGKTAYVVANKALIPVDLSTGTVGRPVMLPSSNNVVFLTGVAVSPDSKTVYALLQNNLLDRISAVTDRPLAPIRFGTTLWQAEGEVFGPDGKTLYILSDPNSLLPHGYDPSIVTPIRIATGAVGKPIRLGSVALYVVFAP